MTFRLVLLRHGETVWNKGGRLTGWADIDLSEKGVAQARDAGRLLKEAGFTFDIVFTSVLRRAVRTVWLVLDEMDLLWIPVKKTWRLNERHYGVLQGLNRVEAAEIYGREQVALWKRSFNTKPPRLDKKDERHPRNDPRYKDLDENDIPSTESLKDTLARALPYWQGKIVPTIKSGKEVLVVTHGDIIRALAKHLEAIGDREVENLKNIATGISLVYQLDKDMKAISHYPLGKLEGLREGWEQL